MRAYDLLLKKRDGEALTEEELNYLISGYTSGKIPDYQIASWLMAVYFRGMTTEETAFLTKIMLDSGEKVDLSCLPGVKVDKHSTGGVGDTTTLVLLPLVASLGVPIAKMSGRGLGHTGGTIDKLESIPGFKTGLAQQAFLQQIADIGVAVAGQNRALVPADDLLYKLRDVTATVESMPLIASSIMSKKLASGADSIVLDVKVGCGAFMKNLEDARRLARTMVDLGEAMQRKTIAVLTQMNQPLGLSVGNALEVREAIAVLQNEGPDDLRELCLTLGSFMLYLGQKAECLESARELLKKALATGLACQKFADFLEAQGGNKEVINNPDLLPRAEFQELVLAEKDGFVGELNAYEIGRAAMLLGAGREKKDDLIDPAAGIVLHKKLGEPVKKGEALAELHTNDCSALAAAQKIVKANYILGAEKPGALPLIYEMIGHI